MVFPVELSITYANRVNLSGVCVFRVHNRVHVLINQIHETSSAINYDNLQTLQQFSCKKFLLNSGMFDLVTKMSFSVSMPTTSMCFQIDIYYATKANTAWLRNTVIVEKKINQSLSLCKGL